MTPKLPCSNEGRQAVMAALGRVPGVEHWLGPLEAVIREPRSVSFRAAYARASRLLGDSGKAPLPTSFFDHECTRPHWTLLDLARFSLVAQALDHLEDRERPPFVDALLRAGELGEQVSLLRTLWALPGSQAFVASAVEACRSNAVLVFEAIACENPYPAAVFDSLAFNQMVIKAIFLEVSVRRVENLASRAGPELVRMATGLESERSAAGRPIPSDIAFIVEQGGRF